MCFHGTGAHRYCSAALQCWHLQQQGFGMLSTNFKTLVSNLNCLCTHPHRALRTTSGLHLYTHTSGLSIPSRLVLLSVRLQCCAVCFVRQLVGSPVSRRLCMMSCYYLKCTMSNPRQKTCAVCVVGWLWVPYLPHADA